MKKVLVAYVSVMGNTKQMADYIAEGIRISGHDAEVRKVSEIKSDKELQGFDGYVFGCPTYHRDMTENMKTFLFMAKKAGLEGKVGGAFGSHTHSGDAPKLIFDTMEFVYKMNMIDLGSLTLKEDILDKREGMKACHDYGKAIGEKLGK